MTGAEGCARVSRPNRVEIMPIGTMSDSDSRRASEIVTDYRASTALSTDDTVEGGRTCTLKGLLAHCVRVA